MFDCSRRFGGRFGAPLLATLLSSVCAPAALAQAVGEPATVASVKPEAETNIGASAPDPLTPKAEPATPLAAPGSSAAPAATPRAKPDAVVAAVVRTLGSPESITATSPEGRDRKALAAFYNDVGGKALWASTDGPTEHAKQAVAELQRAADWGLDPAAFEVPASWEAAPDAAAKAEIAIGLAVLKYARHARGGRLDPTSISKAIDRTPRLYEPRSVIDAIATAAEPDAYLRDLHPRHAGFRRLQKALASARAETGTKADTVQRLVVNLERWRWLPDDLGDFHVIDNVPEQMTRVINNGRVVFTERIVVGKPTQQTPEFSAPMRYVIFHPSWGVPDGIKTNEIGPMLRRAAARSSGGGWLFGGGSDSIVSRSLARHELVVMQNGRPINPDSVDWNRVDVRQFQFTQPPSGKNVLGIVKFRFPNKFDVYMHDTQDKHLFAHNVRAYSHGCMRVQNPLKLAEVILNYDKGWGAERIQSLVARGQTADITLEKQVPVHITYFTAAADENGKVSTFADLYGRDARIASALAGKPVAIASVASPAEKAQPASAPAATPAARKAEARKRPVASKTQASEFNPFGTISAN